MSDHSGAESCQENGTCSNGVKEEPVNDNGDHNTVPHDESPIPGTSKSGGVRRRSSKESKRHVPDLAEGCSMTLCFLVES